MTRSNIKREEIEKYLQSLPKVEKVFPFGDAISVYQYQQEMFALLANNKEPIKISLRCDLVLANILREKYDEIMPGEKLDKKKWNTIVLSGQLTLSELSDLIYHAYSLVGGSL